MRLICQSQRLHLVYSVFLGEFFQEGFKLLGVVVNVDCFRHTLEEIFSVAPQLVVVTGHDRGADWSTTDFLIVAIFRGCLACNFIAHLDREESLVPLLLLDSLLLFLQQAQLHYLVFPFLFHSCRHQPCVDLWLEFFGSQTERIVRYVALFRPLAVFGALSLPFQIATVFALLGSCFKLALALTFLLAFRLDDNGNELGQVWANRALTSLFGRS